jgi:hypothetical protein
VCAKTLPSEKLIKKKNSRELFRIKVLWVGRAPLYHKLYKTMRKNNIPETYVIMVM